VCAAWRLDVRARLLVIFRCPSLKIVPGAALPGSPGALLRRGPLSTGRAHSCASGASKPLRTMQVRDSAVLPAGALGVAAPAGGVHKTDPVVVGCVRVHVDGQIVSGGRLADSGEPFFPLAWAVGFTIGMQQSVPTQGTATTLGLKQTQGGAVQQGRVLATPVDPVWGQGNPGKDPILRRMVS
jgi:hypothetical protein